MRTEFLLHQPSTTTDRSKEELVVTDLQQGNQEKSYKGHIDRLKETLMELVIGLNSD